MERVAHDAPHGAARMQLLGQTPEIAMQDGIAAGDVEVGLAAHTLAQVIAAVQHMQHVVPGHGLARHARILAEQVAMLASLIALVGDMPLEGEGWTQVL